MNTFKALLKSMLKVVGFGFLPLGTIKLADKLTKCPEKPSIVIDIIRAMFKSKVVVFALIFLAIFYLIGLVAVFGEIFHFSPTPYDYDEIDKLAVRAPPSPLHWFGTDTVGRDLFTRVIFSMGVVVGLSVLVILFSGVVGIILGLIAGYRGGLVDSLIMRGGEVLSAVPPFFMILYLTVSLRSRYDEFFYSLGGTGEYLINSGFVDFALLLSVMSLLYWVSSARIIRSEVMKLREMPYIAAARVLGASSARIIVRHILPNIAGIIALWMFQILGQVVLMEVGVSFFGLGIRAPHPSFGMIFSEISSVRLLKTVPHMLLLPGLIVTLFILAFAFLEMRLNVLINTLYSKGGGK